MAGAWRVWTRSCPFSDALRDANPLHQCFRFLRFFHPCCAAGVRERHAQVQSVPLRLIKISHSSPQARRQTRVLTHRQAILEQVIGEEISESLKAAGVLQQVRAATRCSRQMSSLRSSERSVVKDSAHPLQSHRPLMYPASPAPVFLAPSDLAQSDLVPVLRYLRHGPA